MLVACCVSVSSEVPEHPVLSPVSGHLFERRLIEKYISENGTDPVNNEKLQLDMLIDVKSKCSSFSLLFFFMLFLQTLLPFHLLHWLACNMLISTVWHFVEKLYSSAFSEGIMVWYFLHPIFTCRWRSSAVLKLMFSSTLQLYISTFLSQLCLHWAGFTMQQFLSLFHH